MKRRTVVAGAFVVFLLWIGYLAYLVVATYNPVLLSRPQYLVADVYVLAELTGVGGHPDARVTIKTVYWPEGEAGLQGKALHVTFLDKCERVSGWRGPGAYLLPLSKAKSKTNQPIYTLTPIPPSPGYHVESPKYRLRIYEATPLAREQLDELIAEWKQN